MVPFFRHCKKLKSIKSKFYESNDDLDLIALNQERKKFGKEASQVSICVPEDIHLRERWNSKNANSDHVKIARLDDEFDLMNLNIGGLILMSNYKKLLHKDKTIQ